MARPRDHLRSLHDSLRRAHETVRRLHATDGGEEPIGRLLSIVFRIGQAHLARRLAPLGLGTGQHPILTTLLHDEDGVNQDVLARRLHMDKGAVARALRKLEEDGFVSREQDSADRRNNRVFLTPKGRGIAPELFAILRGASDALEAGFSPRERKMVRSLLRRMADNAARLHEGSQGGDGAA